MQEETMPQAPGQYYIKNWIIYDALGAKHVDISRWSLGITGLVKNELSFNYEQLLKMEQASFTGDFDCVTKWSIKDVKWGGVLLKPLIQKASPKENARFAMFMCADGYSTPVLLEEAMSDNAIIVLNMYGEPLKFEHGAPARPFIPTLYGWKSAKWLTEIRLMNEYQDGYWEQYGYHDRGRKAFEERFKSYEWKSIKKHILNIFN